MLVGIGAWTTGKDTVNEDIRSSNTILAAHGGVFVGAEFYASVTLEAFIDAMLAEFIDIAAKKELLELTDLRTQSDMSFKLMPSQSNLAQPLGYDSFFSAMSLWLTDDDIMVVDAGFPFIGAQSVKVPSRNGFVAQAAWLSIGYSVPAGTGIKCAFPDKRAIVVVGDGAFHETCQAVADQHAYGQNTVVFVIANGIYGIEQYLVNPNPFRQPPVDYPDKLLNDVYHYNDLPNWEIAKITDAFGGEGRKVTSVEQLYGVLEEIRADEHNNYVVELCIPKDNVPNAITVEADSAVGEDEIDNPNWPSVGKF